MSEVSSAYDAAGDQPGVPTRDEMLIELSIALGQASESAYKAWNQRGQEVLDQIRMDKDVHQKVLMVLKRAIAFTKSAS